VNSPKIQKWLGKVVAGEDDNLTRHDKWLCMMYPRLKLLRELLSDDGIIFVSIDENEVNNLSLIMNEIFDKRNFRNAISVRRFDKNINLQFIKNGLTSFNVGFEYVLVYSKNPETKLKPIFREPTKERSSKGYWKGFHNDADRRTMRYDILGVTPKSGQWKWKKEVAFEAIKNYQEYEKKHSKLYSLEKYWLETGKTKKFIRRKLSGKGTNRGVEHWIPPSEGILRNTLWNDIFASGPIKNSDVEFDNPKNVEMIKNLIQISTYDDSIILDSFAGSGTTGEAVIQINVETKSKRKFILIELEKKIAENKTSKRINDVINNQKSKNSIGFQYAILDKKLFNSDGRINNSCTFEELASYIYFTETKTILDTQPKKTLIATHNDTDYHLIFNGIGKNSLDRKFLSSLDRQKNKVIYADKCTLDDSFLEKHNTVFKQIPYEVREF
jgi:adenine specific DNA methylase Mod